MDAPCSNDFMVMESIDCGSYAVQWMQNSFLYQKHHNILNCLMGDPQPFAIYIILLFHDQSAAALLYKCGLAIIPVVITMADLSSKRFFVHFMAMWHKPISLVSVAALQFSAEHFQKSIDVWVNCEKKKQEEKKIQDNFINYVYSIRYGLQP